MSINRDLLQTIDGHGLANGHLQDFLSAACPSERLAEAKTLTRELVTAYGKATLGAFVDDLADLERGIFYRHPKHRDHVVHAVLTFVLGMYFNTGLDLGVDPFQWLMASLFHDIGYVVEKGSEYRVQRWSEAVNKLRSAAVPWSRPEDYGHDPGQLEHLPSGRNAVCLIQGCMRDWCVDVSVSDYVQSQLTRDHPDHGVIGALTMLYAVDSLYSRNPTWHQTRFETDIVPACAAMMLHSMDWSRYGNNVRMSRTRAPLAYLLRLSDGLQEWERPSGGNRRGHPAADFAIAMEGDRLVFSVCGHPCLRRKVQLELEAALDLSGVDIRDG